MAEVLIPTLLLVNTSIIDPNVHYGPEFIFKYVSSAEKSTYDNSNSDTGNVKLYVNYVNFETTLRCQHHSNGSCKDSISLICNFENSLEQKYTEVGGVIIGSEQKKQMGTDNSRSKMFEFNIGEAELQIRLPYNFDINFVKIVDQVIYLFEIFWINKVSVEKDENYILEDKYGTGKCTFLVKAKSVKDSNITDDNNTLVFLKSPKPGLIFFYKRNIIDGSCEGIAPEINLHDLVQRVVISSKFFLSSLERRSSAFSQDSPNPRVKNVFNHFKSTLTFVRVEPAVKLFDSYEGFSMKI